MCTRGARKYNKHGGVHITHTHTHALRRSCAFANIEYSNYRLSISFPTGLLTISACRCSASSAFASIFPRRGFSLRHCVFLARARFHVLAYISAISQKGGLVTFQFTTPLFSELLLSCVNNGCSRERIYVHAHGIH